MNILKDQALKRACYRRTNTLFGKVGELMVTQKMNVLLILQTESGYVTAGGSDELMSRLKEGGP